MRVAYFINNYPKVSHSFIRREILALERLGIGIERFALRGWSEELADRDDIEERGRTKYVLENGLPGLVFALLHMLAISPRKFFSGLFLTLRLGRHATRSWPYHLVYFAEACRLVLWLRQAQIRHLHAHFGTNSADVLMLAHHLSGIPFSFTVHGPEEFDRPQALHLRDKIQSAAFVVAISSYGRSQLYRWIDHTEWPKVKVVHCGLERSFHDVPACALPENRRLVCVGRICEQKGQLLLVEAASRLAEKGVDFELVLAGDGEMRREVEALIAKHGLAERVRITGWISSDQVRDEILAARGLVLPSFAEGLPVVIMEAMALRRPVLTTYVAGIPELVLSGENGWLFPAGSVDDLEAAMADFLAKPDDVLVRMGEAAYQRVLVRHDIDTEAQKLAALFRESSA